jgi:hypothetical protein
MTTAFLCGQSNLENRAQSPFHRHIREFRPEKDRDSGPGPAP